LKLADLYNLDGTLDVNDRAPSFVQDQLVSAGLEELASFDFWDEEVWRFYVATDAGIYVGIFTPRHDFRFEPKLEATVVPWSDVKGARISITGFVRDESAVGLKIDEPAFEHLSERDRELKPLAEFGRICLQRQGKPGR
jgi:hypothetical protein